MTSHMRWATTAVAIALSLSPAVDARADDDDESGKVCETFVVNPQSEAGNFKTLCFAAEDRTAGRAEAFDDGRVHINVWGWCREGKQMKCKVSGNLSEWQTFWEGTDEDIWYSSFAPLLSMVCYCQHWYPPPTSDD